MEIQRINNEIKRLEKDLEQEKIFDLYKNYNDTDRVISSHELAEKYANEQDNEVKLFTKMPTLNLLIDGFEGGELIVITGITKMGKTSFCRTLTNNFAENNVNAIWFSYEEPMRQFLKKFTCLPLFYAPEELKDKRLDWIEQRIVEGIAKYGAQAVFIDNLHFIVDLEMSTNTSLRIGKIIGDLKNIAMKYNIVVFLLAHLKQMEYNKTPTHHDIRDSSLIAQTADSCLLIHRLQDKDTKEFNNKADLYVHTHRRMGVMGKKVNLIYQDNQYQELNENYNQGV